ncbi:MAG: hypothetical protein ACXV3U_06980 [Halobacteriota archaeon]
MRRFHVTKATEFEAALIENGIGFEHPNDDPNTFSVEDDAIDVVDDMARKMMIDVYIEDPFITQQDTQSD